jgi:hypothetical protein
VTPADHNESFILKIAQNLKIKKSLAKEYYAEYLRFIYLAAISETPITIRLEKTIQFSRQHYQNVS